METTKTNISYEIKDTTYGVKAFLHLPEGDFTLTLKPRRGANSRRVWEIAGNYPKDKYCISYDGGNLLILDVDNTPFTVGQEINHRAFGKGKVTSVNGDMVAIDFEKVGEKTMMSSLLRNVLA
jgi:hypothetical protein